MKVDEPQRCPPAATEYFCPICPGVKSDKPGDCPKCGLALEPKTISATPAEENHELTDMTRRFWIGAALTLPVFVLAMAHMVRALNHQAWLTGEASRRAYFVFSTPDAG